MFNLSYYEVNLKSGRLLASLGSGPAEEIFARNHTDPSMRLLLREPAEAAVEFRVRGGVVQLTSSGLVDTSLHDATQLRGAWLPIAICGWVWTLLGRTDKEDHSIASAITTGWLKVTRGGCVACSADEAWRALNDGPADIDDQKIILRVGGGADEIYQMLSLLRDANGFTDLVPSRPM